MNLWIELRGFHQFVVILHDKFCYFHTLKYIITRPSYSSPVRWLLPVLLLHDLVVYIKVFLYLHHRAGAVRILLLFLRRVAGTVGIFLLFLVFQSSWCLFINTSDSPQCCTVPSPWGRESRARFFQFPFQGHQSTVTNFHTVLYGGFLVLFPMSPAVGAFASS